MTYVSRAEISSVDGASSISHGIPSAKSENAQIYTPLGHQNESRLVHLYPGGHNDPIPCSLHHFNVLSPPPYEALSYAWGDPNVTLPITVDGRTLHVTTNLDIALRHLRWPRQPRILWIDAIVINQEDLKERAHQVSLMAHIYSKAASVRVWLGPTDMYSNFVMQYYKNRRLYVRSLKATTRRIQRACKCWESQGRSLSFLEQRTPFLERWERKQLGKAANLLLVIFGGLLLAQKTWFTRRWCIQEVAVGRIVVVQCGSAEITWEQLTSCLADMQTFCHSLRETGFKRAIERWSVQLSRVAPLVHDDQLGKSTLSDSLIRFRHWQNGDPRDTVYGLLALTGIKKGQFEIKPDYTRPVLDVLVDAVEYAIEVEESLALVAVPWAPSIPGLPTWIVPLEKEVGLLEDPWGGSIPPDLESTFYPLLRSKVMKAQILRPSKEDVFGTRQSSGYVLKVLGLTLNGFLWLPDVWDNSSLMEGHFHPYLPGIQDWEDRRPSDRIVLIPGCQRIVLLRQLDDGFVLVGSLTALAGEAILSYMRKQELDQLMSSPKETFIIY